MVKVKTFTIPFKIFHVQKALEELDQQVSAFLSDEKAVRVASVSDTTTNDDSGATIGLIRTVAYES